MPTHAGVRLHQLVLVRHGEALPPAPGQADRERDLTARGEEQARAAGERIAARWAGSGPGPRGGAALLLHSTAVRTTRTAELLAAELPVAETWPAPAVYDASPEDLVRVLADVPDEVHRVVLVGHVPGLPALVGQLTGEWPEVWVPGSHAVLELEEGTSWEGLAPDCARLVG
ncbi:phosphohistidine phosphatase [Kytococcus aerolatus]|uniref:Phosphohistidine phosphatase n=1 Tax=Kytococcus aerolatus TaxID=592308 RepID=A0A212U0U4_9MICO|nr:histidine phosphatase family protein [Kytococcus aerolatus]SNC71863.1 phosphohistidine phosphatase [Kytococcus aerolatus]